jgi:ABC-type microcin C transport system duplicated ATPase subunit YejF
MFARRRVLKAVDDVSVTIRAGHTLGIVGESGSGKTTLALAMLRLIKSGGEIELDGQQIHALRTKALRPMRKQMQVVFQDPYGSLSPRLSVNQIISAGLGVHQPELSNAQKREIVAEALREVGIDPALQDRYPHEFSGGQRQRISVARALAVQPRLIICDESVSALDVSVQAQVLNLLKDLQEERGLTYIFISHDLSVVKFMSDMMAVMLDGRIVEQGPSEAIYMTPREEYTRRLIEAVPDDSIANIESRQQQRREARSRRHAN